MKEVQDFIQSFKKNITFVKFNWNTQIQNGRLITEKRYNKILL